MRGGGRRIFLVRSLGSFPTFEAPSWGRVTGGGMDAVAADNLPGALVVAGRVLNRDLEL